MDREILSRLDKDTLINIIMGYEAGNAQVEKNMTVKFNQVERKSDYDLNDILGDKPKTRVQSSKSKGSYSKSYKYLGLNIKEVPSLEEFNMFCDTKIEEYKSKVGHTIDVSQGTVDSMLNYMEAFRRCYAGKLSTWKGGMDLERLFNNWITRKF